MKELKFRVRFRQFEAGDPVPAEWDDGVRGTLAQVGKAEWVEVADAPAEKMCVPEADKMLRASSPRVKRKGVGE